MLRDYQQRTIDELYNWFSENETGNVCAVLPTGSGKSHIIAALCKDAVQRWPSTRILMLTHVKELIEQNAQKMREHWPNAPLGVYSASIGKRQIGQPITFAGIQSVRKRAKQIGHIDICIIDECHLISHEDTGAYRTLINDLLTINPALRVIGLSATPYRLGHGLITDKPALFDALIEPVKIEELVAGGYLCKLLSKHTSQELVVTGVHKRGGEYIAGELEEAVNKDDKNRAIVEEVIGRAGDRQSWIFFCSGVKHAKAIADILNERGISAACVTGETAKNDRKNIIQAFRRKKIKALTNANVLTTGFDAPDIDLIVMMRPTMSPSLYVQMAGRGMRPKSHGGNCMVLDFAGVVKQHGPITDVQPPKRKGGGGGEMPMKFCEECFELVHISAKICPSCGHPFPAAPEKAVKLHADDIMGIEPSEMIVKEWGWSVHTSRATGNNMLKITYYAGLTEMPISEYLPLLNEGYAAHKAMQTLGQIAAGCGIKISDIGESPTLELVADYMAQQRPPSIVKYKKDGKFFRVLERVWND